MRLMPINAETSMFVEGQMFFGGFIPVDGVPDEIGELPATGISAVNGAVPQPMMGHAKHCRRFSFNGSQTGHALGLNADEVLCQMRNQPIAYELDGEYAREFSRHRSICGWL